MTEMMDAGKEGDNGAEMDAGLQAASEAEEKECWLPVDVLLSNKQEITNQRPDLVSTLDLFRIIRYGSNPSRRPILYNHALP
jgi:hypothetical protein